jgi:ADP-ribose pyrophosphatase YjhB (NUDIX family)
MSIRSAARALVIKDGKVLLVKYRDERGDFYTMPGGGQNQYETLTDAVIRECREETGYAVRPVRLACVCEDIWMDQATRDKYPDYAHKLHHIFICEPSDEEQAPPTEMDMNQVCSEWVEVQNVGGLRVFPKAVGGQIIDILDGNAPAFLGTEHIDSSHG